MVNHKQHRASLLNMVEGMPSNRRRGKAAIGDQDYIAFPLPLNLHVPPHGDCLIWVGSLDDGGYGTGTFPSVEKRAHREAFRMSRSYVADGDVLHLCHRPYCIQPSHLYDGSKQDNSDDASLRRDDFPRWESFERASTEAQQAAKYRWPSPKNQQPPMISVGVRHDCEFILPAGIEKLCSICGEPQTVKFRGDTKLPDMQPVDTDRNSYVVVEQKRRFTDLDTGTLESNMKVELHMPKNRAERRRIERSSRKLEKKARRTGEPILLGSGRGLMGPDGSRFSGELPGGVAGPALVVWTMQKRPIPQPMADEMARLRKKYVR